MQNIKVKKSGSLFLDFEFNRVKEKHVNLVSCVTYDGYTFKEFWLHNNKKEQKELSDYLRQFKTLVSYSVVAEARSLLALGFSDQEILSDIKWIDLYLEYKCLTNHNHDLCYGSQLVNGNVINTKKPLNKYQRMRRDEQFQRDPSPDDDPDDDNSPGFKPTHSLAECTYKLLGVIRDTDHKNKMRDLIISDPDVFTETDKQDILKYNVEDVLDLKPILEKMFIKYKELGITDTNTLYKDMRTRGQYAAATAIMETIGYPILVEEAKNFSRSAGYILEDTQREINTLFPNFKIFKWDMKEQKYNFNQKKVAEWIMTTPFADSWPRTETDRLSLKLETFENFYPYKHEYPKNELGAQIVRYLKLRQHLYGFSPSGNKKSRTIFDYIGSDNRVRPYMGIYGAQSGRSQPAASGFLFLKGGQFRSLCQPPPGQFLASIDYSSQEFLISAVRSKDQNMIDAYRSGDVYLAFGKQIGMIPLDGTKASHKFERDVCKSTVLGLSYDMTKKGLSKKLTVDTGIIWTEEQAQEQIDKFENAFSVFMEWKLEQLEDYHRTGFIRLPCGWTMFGDNDNLRSVGNCLIQGCVHPDEKVFILGLGYIPISQAPTGRRFDIWDGDNFVKAECSPSGNKKIVEVWLSDGSVVRVSPEHRFLTISGRGVEKFKKVTEFNKTEFVRPSRNMACYDFLSPLPEFKSGSWNGKNISLNDIKDKYRLGVLLGRLASDGTCSPGRGAVWRVAEHEVGVLDVLLDYLKPFGSNVKVAKKTWGEKNNSTGYQVHLYSQNIEKQLHSELIDIDRPFFGKALWMSKEFMRGYLRGYIDGDGGVCSTNGSGNVQISFGRGQTKKESSKLLVQALRLFGIHSTSGHYKDSSRVRIRRKHNADFLREIGFINEKKNLKIPPGSKRKASVVGEYLRVLKVVDTGETIGMFDIVNSESGKFMVSGVVTHNSGAAIMRKAVVECYKEGIEVIFTLHDAIYIQGKIGEEWKIKRLAEIMKDAFIYYFDEDSKKDASLIRLDPYAWSPDYPSEEHVIEVDGFKCDATNFYIDERSINEYNQFKQYFKRPMSDLL